MFPKNHDICYFHEIVKINDRVSGRPFFSLSGGRNMTISLQSRTGHMNMEGVVGMLVFTQFWFWYPLTLFLSMAFTPTCLVGLNEDLKVSSIKSQIHACVYYVVHITDYIGRFQSVQITNTCVFVYHLLHTDQAKHQITCI